MSPGEVAAWPLETVWAMEMAVAWPIAAVADQAANWEEVGLFILLPDWQSISQEVVWISHIANVEPGVQLNQTTSSSPGRQLGTRN